MKDLIQVSVIIPTFNEKENLPLLISGLEEIMKGHSFEMIVVDDNSEDGTWRAAKDLSLKNPHLHVIRRIHRRGLSSAIVEGLLLGKGAFLAVVDADLQHDIRLLPRMLEEIEHHDVVIGSRYLDQKAVPGWNQWRSRLSRLGTRMARRLAHWEVTDPLSGFFMIRRDLIQEIAPHLHPHGFKTLLDILIRSPQLRVKELPYQFGMRLHGASKLDSKVILDFGDLLISKTFLSRWNAQFVRYGMIGASGIAVHFLILYLLHVLLRWPYAVSLVVAIETAMASNYIWNNQWTFAEQRFLRSEWWRGFLRYNTACSMGGLYNLAIAWYLVAHGMSWVLASALGIWVGVGWNYLANKSFTWKR